MTDTRVVSSKSGSSRQSLIPSTDVIQLDVGLSVGISVTESVPSKKVHVVVVFTKNVV